MYLTPGIFIVLMAVAVVTLTLLINPTYMKLIILLIMLFTQIYSIPLYIIFNCCYYIYTVVVVAVVIVVVVFCIFCIYNTTNVTMRLYWRNLSLLQFRS